MKNLFALLIALVCSFDVLANTLKETTCNNGSCIEIESVTAFEAKKESSFTVTLLDNVDSVQELKIYLWMIMPNGHEHGTAPLKITQVAPNKYLCEKAFFVMKGKWQIKVEYKTNGVEQKFVQPLIIE